MRKLVLAVLAVLVASCTKENLTIQENPTTLVGTTWRTDLLGQLRYRVSFLEGGKLNFQLENTAGDSVVYENLFSYEYFSGVGKFIRNRTWDGTIKLYLKGSKMILLSVDDTEIYMVGGDTREPVSAELLVKIKDLLSLNIKMEDGEKAFVIFGNKLEVDEATLYRQ